jgi:hypothetical protein
LTRLKWKLVLVHLDILLILTQDRCTVCAEYTVGLEVMSNLVSVRLEMVLVSVQDRCMVCAKRSIGSIIILDTPEGTLRSQGSSGSSFWSVLR